MKNLILFLAIAGMIACKPKDTAVTETPTVDSTQVDQPTQPPGLRMMWESEKTLTTSESVLYDKANNILYVSCINGVPPDKKDNDGYIAQVGMDGKVINPKWASGLSAPKGMAIHNGLLYVTDIDKLVAIDMTNGQVKQSWPVEGAKFLNDVAVGEDGTIYFTDSGTTFIHALKDNTVTTIYKENVIGGVNGIHVTGNQLYLSGYDSNIVYALNLDTKEVQKLAEDIPSGDGIRPYGDGWIVSNWNGEVFHISANGEVLELLDSQEAKLNAADIEVIEDKNMLLIPTFFGNHVVAYELVRQ